jgi:hypothetical protein
VDYGGLADRIKDQLSNNLDSIEKYQPTSPSPGVSLDSGSPFAGIPSSALELPKRSAITVDLSPFVADIGKQTKAVVDTFGAKLSPGTTDKALTDRAQHAADQVDHLVRTEETALESPHLGDHPVLQTAYQATKEVRSDIRDFLRAHPETSRPLTLTVASPMHGEVHVTGLAHFIPARAVVARDSTAVVVGDNCTLQSGDHYHVEQVSIPLKPLLEPGSKAHDALVHLAKNPTEAGISQFQGELQKLIQPPEQHDLRVSIPVSENHVMVVTGSDLVQRGNGSDLDMTTNYVVERSELPVIELLANDSSLVQSFIDAAAELEPGPATDAFLRGAVGAAGRVDDLALLDHCTGLDGPATSVWALFGVDAVSHAAAAMVGTNNTLHTDMEVDCGGLASHTILNDLDAVRSLFAQEALKRQEATSLLAPRQPEPGPIVYERLPVFLPEVHHVPEDYRRRTTVSGSRNRWIRGG